MFRTPKEAMTEVEVQPTWEYLVKRERALRRNVVICRIIQPVGAVIFSLNLLLASMNLLLYALGDRMSPYFETLPVLPTIVQKLPHESFGGVLVFFVLFAFVVPLAVCGIIAAIFYLTSYCKYRDVQEPLVGTPAQCAKALTNKAETVYELRRKMPRWSIYLETGILTAITALLVVLMFIDYASGDAMPLQLVLIALALLVCLFVVFWVYALLMYMFALTNSLYYLSPGEWKLYELYHRVDAYWETIDPMEFARRQSKAEGHK